MQVNIINRTIEVESLNPEELREDMTRIAGKAAGICYMNDDYLSDGIQNNEQAIKRAKGTAKSGHYSTYEHGHISFLFSGISKMMAMVLNSTLLYNTSEKSARYTAMNGTSELEQQKYAKWCKLFNELIKPYYGNVYNEKEMNKLAMENARYMISVFTPTVMEYTLPYNRAVMMPQWLDRLANTIDELLCLDYDSSHRYNNPYKKYNWYYDQVSKECKELAKVFRDQLGITKEDLILEDHKNMPIEFFRIPNYIMQLDGIPNARTANTDYCYLTKREDIYSDCYISNYKASFAEVAQAERHRTLHYRIDLPYHDSELSVYVPKIIRGSAYELEWKQDFKELIDHKIMPQGTLLEVTESGRFEDFYKKCKERLCSRAQLEIMEITRDQVVKFAQNSDNLCSMNLILLGNMIRPGEDVNWKKPDTIIVESRCKFAGYKCKEPCKIANSTINYYRNI